MNVDNVIKKWLVAAGTQYGINDAYNYRWPDSDTITDPYCTYEHVSCLPTQTGIQRLNTSSSYTVTHRSIQKHETIIRIHLYNSQNGMYELAAMAIAAQSIPMIRSIFDDTCAFKNVLEITDATTFDDEEITYHQFMIVRFEENVEISIDQVNGEVEQVDTTLETGNPTYEITRSGITVT